MTRRRRHPGVPAHPAGAMRAAHRRGVTFLEAVLGVVLLGLITASLAGSVSFMHRSQVRHERHLGAAELANRLILQLIDDRETLPSPSLPIEYHDALFRWSLDEQPVRFVTRTQGVSTASGSVGGGVSLDRIKLVTVRVWLAPSPAAPCPTQPMCPMSSSPAWSTPWPSPTPTRSTRSSKSPAASRAS
jgi:hypothetical protein